MSAKPEMKKLFSSSGVTTKDRIMSLRVEEALYVLLEELTEEWKTDTVSQTLRTLLSLYFIPVVYEQEWRKIQEENLSEFLRELEAEGKTIELERFKKLLSETSKYVKWLRSMEQKFTASADFFSAEVSKVEKAVEKLEGAQIGWKGELFEQREKV